MDVKKEPEDTQTYSGVNDCFDIINNLPAAKQEHDITDEFCSSLYDMEPPCFTQMENEPVCGENAVNNKLYPFSQRTSSPDLQDDYLRNEKPENFVETRLCYIVPEFHYKQPDDFSEYSYSGSGEAIQDSYVNMFIESKETHQCSTGSEKASRFISEIRIEKSDDFWGRSPPEDEESDLGKQHKVPGPYFCFFVAVAIWLAMSIKVLMETIIIPLDDTSFKPPDFTMFTIETEENNTMKQIENVQLVTASSLTIPDFTENTIKIEEIDVKKEIENVYLVADTSIKTSDCTENTIEIEEINANKGKEVQLVADTSKTSDFTENTIEIEEIDVKKETKDVQLVAAISLEKTVFYEKYFVCGICAKIFETNLTLKRHKIVHHSEKRTLRNFYKCDRCNYKSHHVNQTMKHILIHLEDKIFQCNRCEFETNNTNHLKMHQKIHLNITLFRCGKCCFACRSAKTLRLHKKNHSVQIVHPKKANIFKCHKCDYESRRHYGFQKHLLTHLDDKPFECALKCKSSGYLQSHTVIGSGEILFKCCECEYKSVQASDLTKHIVVHTGIIPYQCPECDFSCFDTYSFEMHQIKHGDEANSNVNTNTIDEII